MAVNVIPGQATAVTTGGTFVQVFPANIAGGIITNPLGAPGPLYVNPINAATVTAAVSTFALQPGQSWEAIPGQTSPTTVNASVDGQVFSAVYWL